DNFNEVYGEEPLRLLTFAETLILKATKALLDREGRTAATEEMTERWRVMRGFINAILDEGYHPRRQRKKRDDDPAPAVVPAGAIDVPRARLVRALRHRARGAAQSTEPEPKRAKKPRGTAVVPAGLRPPPLTYLPPERPRGRTKRPKSGHDVRNSGDFRCPCP